MLRTIRDALLAVLTALAGTLLSVFGISRLLRREKDSVEAEVHTTGDQSPTIEAAGREPESASAVGAAKTAELPPGWTRPRPEELPRPTYWPVVMAVGITLAMWGVATTYLLSGVGLLLFGLSLAGWVGDLRAEAEHD